MSDARVIAFVGPFPPPVHGMAAINLAMHDWVETNGGTPIKVNTRARSLQRSFGARLRRLPTALRAMGTIVVLPLATRSMYMSVSAGFGQVYELAFVLIARLRRMRIYLHHHNYAYLDRPTILARALFNLAGRRALHIVLSAGMEKRLISAYSVKSSVAISNLAFVDLPDAAGLPAKTNIQTIGFLSNISREKGVFLFLDMVQAVRRSYPGLQCILAGPFQDDEVRREVQTRIGEIGGIRYLGPVYGERKDEFFSSIDVLIFPTLYKNEAQPIVLLESRARGIPIIAYDRGAISEIVSIDDGELVSSHASFVTTAISVLRGWIESPEDYRRVSFGALARHRAEVNESRCRLECLGREILE